MNEQRSEKLRQLQFKNRLSEKRARLLESLPAALTAQRDTIRFLDDVESMKASYAHRDAIKHAPEENFERLADVLDRIRRAFSGYEGAVLIGHRTADETGTMIITSALFHTALESLILWGHGSLFAANVSHSRCVALVDQEGPPLHNFYIQVVGPG